MITLTGGQFQDASGNLLKKGFLSLQLTSDAAIIAGGQVIRNIPLSFPIINGSLSSSVKVYSNAELSGSTQYFAQVQDANQRRIGDPAIWQFTQSSGATVDVGTIVTVTGGASFPAPVLLNPTAQQKITNFNLELAKALVLDGSSSGSSTLQAPATAGGTNTLPSGAGILAALSLAQIWTAIQQFNLGITLAKSDGTLPASIVNDTSGGINITSNGNKTWEFANAGTLVGPAVTTPLQFQGSTSGFVQIVVPAIAASSVLTLPAATDTLVAQSTTDTLKNKTLQGAASGNAVTLLNTQGPISALVGNSADQTVYTFTIPANTIQAGKGFRIKIVGFHSTGATATTYKITIGSTNLLSTSDSTGNTQNWTFSIYNAAGVQNSQYFEGSGLIGTAIGVNTFGTAAENFANAITVKFTFNVANTDQYTGKLFSVELIQ